MKMELTTKEIEVLQEIIDMYNEQFSDLEMQTPSKEEAYKNLLKKFKIK